MIQYAAMAGYQLVSGYFAAQNARETADLNRDIANMNAEFAELDAYDAKLEGHNKKSRYQGVIENTLADQRTMMEAQGMDSSFGSAASIQAESKFVGELNLMEIEKEAQERVLGYKRQARDFKMGGALAYGNGMARASQIMTESIASAAKTGLTGYERSTGGGGGGGQARSGYGGNTPSNDMDDFYMNKVK
jgi:hypothetical protein